MIMTYTGPVVHLFNPLRQKILCSSLNGFITFKLIRSLSFRTGQSDGDALSPTSVRTFGPNESTPSYPSVKLTQLVMNLRKKHGELRPE